MAGDKHVPCPEFQFSTTACYICNGYYGPCFEEPVCATCHAFLFPNDIGLFQVPIFSEKTDDEDSGNDEPTDLYYNHERRTSQQQQNSPQNVNSNSQNASVNNVNSFSNAESYRVDYGQNLEHVQQYQHCQDNCRQYEREVGEPSRPYNLSDRLEMLTNHKHIEHEPINEPGLVESLPPEVLLAVFSHLDDVSLWSAANVCRRWCGLLSTHVTAQQWQQHVKMRWPLYRPIGCVKNWYKVYDQLASSAPCRTCLAQTSLRTRAPRMEEYYWRRNRLLSELKSLRMDPPEGIEATPLDQMCCHWQATITGPVGSPYEGGLFYLYLQVPYSYPMCPPVVRFLTKILHPNVSRHGDVGIDSIHHNWSLALTISKVLISVQSLLTDPYCQVCMEPELGEMYMNDRERFEEVARAWTWSHKPTADVPKVSGARRSECNGIISEGFLGSLSLALSLAKLEHLPLSVELTPAIRYPSLLKETNVCGQVVESTTPDPYSWSTITADAQ
ncbi:hypothetical protein HZH68_001882 [Vespula germanica]|uniref:E2 ubiquitin-conjugating enzyme n=1 Tax=Vespula germanica TaxID=30212 RepID=A0A834KV13_VESGE|nr:hypothetical protein HZH68_001882 [Vespula germanica]